MNSNLIRRIALTAVASLGLIGLTTATAAQQHNQKSTVVTETKERDTGVFAGAIQAIDPAAQTVTVTGHEVKREEKIKRSVATKNAEHAKQKSAHAEAKDKPAEVTRTFQVPALCQIATAAKPVARFTDLKSGDRIDVTFHVMNTGVNVADSITPATAH